MVYVLCLPAIFFSLFFECQSLAVCSGNSDGGAGGGECCTASRFESKLRRNWFLADNLSRNQG